MKCEDAALRNCGRRVKTGWLNFGRIPILVPVLVPVAFLNLRKPLLLQQLGAGGGGRNCSNSAHISMYFLMLYSSELVCGGRSGVIRGATGPMSLLFTLGNGAVACREGCKLERGRLCGFVSGDGEAKVRASRFGIERGATSLALPESGPVSPRRAGGRLGLPGRWRAGQAEQERRRGWGLGEHGAERG